jgi:glucose/arabinose dehydrogenase
LECEVAYGSSESGEDFMRDNCVLSNKTNTVTLRTDDRNNDITAPLTDQKYEVIKSRSFGENENDPLRGSNILSKDAYFENPWDLVHLEEDRYLVTGVTGEVNDVKNGKNVKYQIDVLKEGPMDSPLDDDPYTGLLGAVPHPNFSQNSIVYLNYAYEVAQGDTTHTRVSKFRLDRDEQEIEKLDTIIEEIPGRLYYHGGRMRFGPKNKFLYITTGAADYSKVQNNSYLGGKLLRFYANGSIPETNPYNNEVYASGLRNPQGLAFNPETEKPYISQHGPWRRDVIAEVSKGANLGWPENCKRSYPEAEKGEEILCPQTWTLAPSGMTFVDDKDHKWYGDLFIAGLRSRQIHRIDMEGQEAVKNEIFWFNGLNSDPYPNYYNRLRDVEFIDGDLWVLHNKGTITRLSPEYSGPMSGVING